MGGGGKLPNALVVYSKLPIWFVNWAKLAILSHSGPLWWEKIGKVVNWVKLLIPSHSEPLWWEKIGKVTNQGKLAVPRHSEPLWWEKIGKVVNQAKLAVLSHSEPLWWYHLVVWSQFAFGSLPPPSELIICSW